MVETSVLAVVLNYERPVDTIACIRSLQSSKGIVLHSLVVDNGSSDQSVDQIKSTFPEIDCVAIPSNIGFTGGMNAGIQKALETDALKIILVSNDTIFEPNTISELLKSSADVTVPKIVFHDRPEIIWAAGAEWRAFPPSVLIRGFMRPDSFDYNQPIDLDFVTGCIIMADRKVFEEVGGFDTEYGSFMEDYDFSARIRDAGFRLAYIPTARVLHKASLTFGFRSPLQYQLIGRNTVLFYRKTKRYSLLQLWINIVWVLLREIVHGRVSSANYYWQGVKLGFSKLRNSHQ